LGIKYGVQGKRFLCNGFRVWGLKILDTVVVIWGCRIWDLGFGI
jgi:hypothetical protein